MALAFLIFSEGFEKTHEKFRGLHTVTTVCPAFLIDVRFLSELRGSLFYFLFRFFEPELTVVLPAFLLFAACTSVATCISEQPKPLFWFRSDTETETLIGP